MTNLILYTNSSTILSSWHKKLDSFENAISVKKESDLKCHLTPQKSYIILYDYNTFKDNFSKISEWIAEEFSNTKILIMSLHPSFREGYPLIQKGIKGYANTYLAKIHLKDAITSIDNGGTWFYPEFVNNLIKHVAVMEFERNEDDIISRITTREYEIGLLVAEGLTNKKIAEITGITERTIKAHISSLYQKLNVNNRVSLALKIKRAG